MKLCSYACLFALAVIFAVAGSTRVAGAQAKPPPTPIPCVSVTNEYLAAVQKEHCQDISANAACYGNYLVQTTPKTNAFSQPGAQLWIKNISGLRTTASGEYRGAAVLVADTSKGQVKIYALANANVAPGSSGQSFTMYRTNGIPACTQTPSGLMLQAPKGKKGHVTINGVDIDLGSTAFVAVEGDLLFDQDPRIGRRQGSRNPNAPLCSGFDSECNFAGCSPNYRLVWGPYCREDQYPYIRTGLYRVTLFGEGAVTAGATDYGSSGNMFSIMSEDLNLPASYTFCWRGRKPGGTGFETVVLSRSPNARVDHLRLEFLSDDCSAAGSLGSPAPDLMTVTNLEGTVTVSVLGRTYSPRPGEEVRIYLVQNRPVRIDPPVRSTALPKSDLLAKLASITLPAVNSGAYPDYSVVSGSYQCSPSYAQINAGECTQLQWAVDNVQAVYLDGGGVVGHDTRQVCPAATHTYELHIVTGQGDQYCRMTVEVATAVQPATYQCSPEYTRINYGDCTDLQWNIEHVQAVYLDGSGVTGNETHRVCPETTHTYELRIVAADGDRYCRMTVDVGSVVSVPQISIVGCSCSTVTARVTAPSGLKTVTLYYPNLPADCNSKYVQCVSLWPMSLTNPNEYTAPLNTGNKYTITAVDNNGGKAQLSGVGPNSCDICIK